MDIIFVGPDKTGSTWLDTQMRSHPGVDMPGAKELFYFDRYYSRGSEWYDSRFQGSPDLARADISHDYLFSRRALRRIANDAPSATVVAFLREPYERAYSAFRYMQYQGRIDESWGFENALDRVDELVEHGRYATLLSQLHEECGTERTLLMLFDDLRSSSLDFWGDFCRSVGLEVSPLAEAGAVLPSTRPRSQAVNRALRSVAWWMRDHGAEYLVGAAKRSVLMRLLSADRLESDETGKATLLSEMRSNDPYGLLADVRYAGEAVGRDLEALWGYDC